MCSSPVCVCVCVYLYGFARACPICTHCLICLKIHNILVYFVCICVSFFLFFSLALFRSLSLSRSLARSLSLSHTHIHKHILSPSLSHTHAHTHRPKLCHQKWRRSSAMLSVTNPTISSTNSAPNCNTTARICL